jgi:hypothetical protein
MAPTSKQRRVSNIADLSKQMWKGGVDASVALPGPVSGAFSDKWAGLVEGYDGLQ